MRKSRRSHASEHIVAIGVAMILVAAVSVGINQSGLLSADILQGSAVSAVRGDISYESEANTLTVRAEKTFEWANSLSFMVVYNPETVEVEEQAIETRYDYTSSSGEEGQMHVTLFFEEPLQADEQLALISFKGSAEDITLTDATVLFEGWNIDGLAIKKQ